ncbi:DUF6082 family protein [Streptomonospora salina]|uniref:Uncharacterized protein n=1 Tax=Streptomonospora salina TaxID=104205 RepID=A0A841DYD3_9ACTN|nr:DUF6082 family protein [Streptomonospora salina]MBB5996447.1 hypothetical protein [Streptomonospora salina]
MSRTSLAVIVVLLVAVAASLVGLSPLVLDVFRGGNSYWERLSFIGQTYGAASALLSVFAIIGVTATLVYQAREVKVAREEARRSAIGDLLKMAMEDPDFNECWGPTGLDEPFKDQRQHMYVNMVLSQWQTSYETGALGDKRLRAIAEEMFLGRVGRRFWEDTREIRMATSENRRARRFHEVLDEAYRNVAHLPIPNPDPPQDHREPSARHRLRRRITPLLWISLGAGSAAIAKKALARIPRS